MIKNIFFDFDGVLAESVNVKTEAFRQLYLPFGKEISDKVVAHHLANGGVSRFEKVKLYHKNWLNEELDEQGVQEWANKFSDLVLKGVVEADEVKGAEEFLRNDSSKYNCWIITGTPTDEIKIILERRNWAGYFKEAFGSPNKKPHWTEHIIGQEGLNREETVFIGDALADYEAAQHSKLHYILRETEDNKVLFEDFDGPRIQDMSQLEEVLQKM
ncbi:MAG: HAD family hydrolase [Bacteroidetes bacterium]|nr:MAG: HAD family hydrolase [Bacteroidota bacterium]